MEALLREGENTKETDTEIERESRRAALNNMEKGDNGFPALAVCLKVWWMKHVWKDD